MLNLSPGIPNFSIIGFDGAYHGKLLGSLSISKKDKKLHDGISEFNWPVLPFPNIKYPLEAHVEHNRKEEEIVLDLARKTIKEYVFSIRLNLWADFLSHHILTGTLL